MTRAGTGSPASAALDLLRAPDGSLVPELVRWHKLVDFTAGHELAPERAHRRLRAMRNVARLAEASRTFQAAGVRHVAIKGPALSQALYGDPARRHPGDIDVLVAPGDLGRAAACLQGLGYVLDDRYAGAEASRRWRSNAEVWMHPDGTMFELHHRLHPASLLPIGRQPDVLGSARPLPLDGAGTVPAPEGPAMLLHLLLHAWGDRWGFLGNLVDIAEVLRRPDAPKLLQDTLDLAARMGTRTAALVGLELAATLTPDAPAIPTTRRSRAIARTARGHWRHARRGGPAWFLLMLRSMDHASDRARFVRATAVPARTDLEATRRLRAPAVVAPIVRAGRLAWKHTGGRLRRRP